MRHIINCDKKQIYKKAMGDTIYQQKGKIYQNFLEIHRYTLNISIHNIRFEVVVNSSYSRNIVKLSRNFPGKPVVLFFYKLNIRTNFTLR